MVRGIDVLSFVCAKAMTMEDQRVNQFPPWAQLQVELLNKVFRDHGLSHFSLFACRAVCRSWRDCCDSPELHAKRWGEPAALYYRYGNSHAEKANHKPAIFLCRRDRWRHLTIPFPTAKGEDLQLVAADGGLLCFSYIYPRHFIVYNPVTEEWREVRVPSGILGVEADITFSCMMIGLAVNREAGSYKLLVGGVRVELSRATLIYDSGTHSWRKSTDVPEMRNLLDDEWNSDKSVYCGGCLYWIIRAPYLIAGDVNWDRTKALLKFDVEAETWAVVEEPIGGGGEWSTQIAMQDGRLLLLDLVSPYGRYSGDMLRLVQPMDLRPISRSIDLWDGRNDPFKCYGQGKILFLVIDEERRPLRLAKYNFETGEVICLPKPPFRRLHKFRFWSRPEEYVYDPWCAFTLNPRLRV